LGVFPVARDDFYELRKSNQKDQRKDGVSRGTKRFYSMITTVEVKDLLVEGRKACALTHYELQPPGGRAFASDVAEVFALQEGRITSFEIYFDSSPFPK